MRGFSYDARQVGAASRHGKLAGSRAMAPAPSRTKSLREIEHFMGSLSLRCPFSLLRSYDVKRLSAQSDAAVPSA